MKNVNVNINVIGKINKSTANKKTKKRCKLRIILKQKGKEIQGKYKPENRENRKMK